MGNCFSKSGAETPIGDPYRAQDNDRPGVPGTLEEPETSTVVRRMGKERVNENSTLLLAQVDPAGDIAESRTGVSGGTSVEVPVDIPSSTMLFSKRAEITMKPGLITAEGKTKMLDAGIQVVDAFQKVADILGLVLPDYLGPILDTLSAVLERLKKMVENKEAWKSLFITIDDHQALFNDQIRHAEPTRLVPGLIEPIRTYAKELGELAAMVMKRIDLVDENAPAASRLAKIKDFASRFYNANSEDVDIQDSAKRLTAAMEAFRTSLRMYTALAVNRIDHVVASIDRKADNLKAIIALSGGGQTAPSGTPRSSCLKGTRVKVLGELRTWNQKDDHSKPIFCIGDVAGTGKSTIAHTVMEEWNEENYFSFFFPKTSTQSARHLCISLAKQIIAFCHAPDWDDYWSHLSSTLSSPKYENEERLWKIIVHQPMVKCTKHRWHVLVVDGLDECVMGTRKALLESMFESCSRESPAHLRILLTTRKEEDIRSVLERDTYVNMIVDKSLLHSEDSAADVARYIKYRSDNSHVFHLTADQQSLLVNRCKGLFIFAFLACELLEDACADDQPLQDILREFTSLDALYHKTISNADKSPRYTRKKLKSILGIILVAREPLTIAAISSLLSFSVESVETLTRKLASILANAGIEEPVYVLHTTFLEFLLRQKWEDESKEERENEYAIKKYEANEIMAKGCFTILSKELETNSFSGQIKDSPQLQPEITSATNEILKQKTITGLRYAASTWTSHVIPALENQELKSAIPNFFKTTLLGWIEFGVTSGSIVGYMKSIHQLQLALEQQSRMLGQNPEAENVQWCRDTLEFMQTNQNLIRAIPSQIYLSALGFCPRESLLYQCYQPLFLTSFPKVLLGHPSRSSKNLALRGHRDNIIGVAYSYSGDYLVSVTAHQETIMWDARTGAQISLYPGTELAGNLQGLSFLPGDKVVAAIWDDKLYRLRRKKADLHRFPEDMKRQGSRFTCVAWAPDRPYFARGTDNGYIHRFWLEDELREGALLNTYCRGISSLAFSQGGEVLASTSWDKTIYLWTVAGAELNGPTTVWHHTGWPSQGIFCSLTSSHFALLDEKSLCIYDCATKTIDFGFNFNVPAWDITTSIVCSLNGGRIALRIGGRSIHIFTPIGQGSTVVSTLETGHSGNISCLCLSPNGAHLVTGGTDHTLWIHNLVSIDSDSTAKQRSAGISSLAFSLDGKRVASAHKDGFIHVWDVVEGLLIRTVFEIGSSLLAIALSYSGHIIVSSSKANEIRFWNAKSGLKVGARLSLQTTLHWSTRGMAFSPDDSHLAILFEEGYIAVLDVVAAHSNQPTPLSVSILMVDSNPSVGSLAFDPLGKFVCFNDQVWKLEESPVPVDDTIRDEYLEKTFLPFVRLDSNIPMSISVGKLSHQIFYIPPEFDGAVHKIFDGLIALGNDNGQILILDFTHLITGEERVRLDGISRARHGRSQLEEIPELPHGGDARAVGCGLWAVGRGQLVL